MEEPKQQAQPTIGEYLMAFAIKTLNPKWVPSRWRYPGIYKPV
jgi:hypothetical protein